MYSQISVTMRPKAAYHSMYLGAPTSAPFSMKSKSRTKLSEAMMTMKTLIPILRGEESWRNPMFTPNSPRTMLIR